MAVRASGQYVTIRGTVFNMYKTHPQKSVSVISISDSGPITAENGKSAIVVNESASHSFS